MQVQCHECACNLYFRLHLIGEGSFDFGENALPRDEAIETGRQSPFELEQQTVRVED